MLIVTCMNVRSVEYSNYYYEIMHFIYESEVLDIVANVSEYLSLIWRLHDLVEI